MVSGAVLTAAGSGTRLGHARPKALVELDGEPLVLRAARALAASGCVAHVVVTAPVDHACDVAALFPAAAGAVRGTETPGVIHSGTVPGTDVPVTVVVGGSTRQASVAAGLTALPDDVDVVLVHDAARALATPELVRRVVDAVRAGHRAVVPAVPVSDTIKEVDVGSADGGGAPVRRTLDRAVLRAVQTPQGFDRAQLEAAHAAGLARAADEGLAASDDAGLVEAMGEPVWVVPGEVVAMKITTPLDLALAELLLR
ncbi:2-C-methyl-D-erythritol 4-phosphate cytidylyltransferase [Georgenia wangjunii]|uniref:2-C-methyl-D-erythritol 4-phosphate cytidylyltransferase n=1 Tax=Georgenia wangjunii TaxID=3117730 RepID=UPI002F26977A